MPRVVIKDVAWGWEGRGESGLMLKSNFISICYVIEAYNIQDP
jgi:hypothetical protein